MNASRSAPLADAANRLLNQKYGWRKRAIDLGATIRNTVVRRGDHVDGYLSITLDGTSPD